jgi:hypothetical protein
MLENGDDALVKVLCGDFAAPLGDTIEPLDDVLSTDICVL